ncbi:tyrosine-type recombinase/integrase [Curtobacterium sp. Csp1]|uniref:tyrosine-type recombinase/integrase n=1 Tax=unclassified Curtobacterium TaxID=257496 RepID=UPI00159AE53D|nr:MULTISPECIES: site-specific integrase [unclassified Curtobacterium]QKS13910.1 tyrosine-type recombinase/integrase [Curtobacterium sp. csp3]QKS20953.1 tyrosine-type recombinase/integrase [Curtobacterium sp. Csp1]
MPRPPLVLGTWGKITRTKRAGSWVAFARFRDFDGITRQVERTGATGRQAEDALVEHLRDRTRLHGGDMTAESHVRVLADRWYDTLLKQNKAAGTLEAYRRNLRVHVEPALGGLRIREVTVPIIDRYLGALEKKSPAAAKTSRVILKGMFSLAVRHGAAPSNPVPDARTVTLTRAEVRTIALDDVVVLRRRLTEWDGGTDGAGRQRVAELGDLVDMLMATAIRTGELLAIRWEDVDLGADDPTVLICGTVVQVRGEGLQRQPHPKNASHFRRLKLAPFAVAMLLRRRSEARTEWVFPSSTGTLRSPNNMRRQWRDFRDHYGYEDWVTPKTFRKTVGKLIRDEVDLETASAALGHSNTKITEDHYTGRVVDGPDIRAHVEALGR